MEVAGGGGTGMPATPFGAIGCVGTPGGPGGVITGGMPGRGGPGGTPPIGGGGALRAAGTNEAAAMFSLDALELAGVVPAARCLLPRQVQRSSPYRRLQGRHSSPPRQKARASRSPPFLGNSAQARELPLVIAADPTTCAVCDPRRLSQTQRRCRHQMETTGCVGAAATATPSFSTTGTSSSLS